MLEVHYMEKNAEMFSSKTFISFRLKKKTWTSWMTWVAKLSAKVFSKVNNSFNHVSALKYFDICLSCIQ